MSGRRHFKLQAVVLCFLLLCGSIALLQFPLTTAAQEGAGHIFISGTDTSSLPEIELRAYGRNAQGLPLNLATQTLTVTHGGQAADSVTVIGSHPVGTLTVFVVDVPPGVSDQLPAIQQAIEGFTTPETMIEQLDYVAIYRVGESSAEQLLEPTPFHNAVRNLFATPLETQAGLTALYDSVVGLLNDVDTLRPNPAMAASLVLITDGTDAVSSQSEAGDIAARASSLGIPVHTIWLNNLNLSDESKEAGRSYLLDVATESGGLSTRLDTPAQLDTIWRQIAAFRDHAVIHYTVPELASGTFPVTLSLADQPAVSASTEVEVPPGAPIIDFDVPPESRRLSLPTLDQPVTLAFSTQLSWLGDVERNPIRAQLFVNNALAQDIDVNELGRFTAEISNFVYGVNSLRLVVVDDAGGQATSPAMLLTIEEGARAIPAELRPGGVTLPTVSLGFPWLFCCFGLLILLSLLGLAAWWFRIRVPGLNRLRGRRTGESNVTYGSADPPPAAEAWAPQESRPAGSLPYIEVLNAETQLPPALDLNGAEVRFGRSPGQADIVFEHDPTVSRLHASIVRDGFEYRLYDEQSTSGTLVNGISVPAHGVALIDGDEIHLGAVHLRFRQP